MGIKFTNFASTVMATALLNPSDTTLAVAPTTGALFPTLTAGDYFYFVMVDSLTAPTKREVIKCTARTGDTFTTLVRAQDGTTAQTWIAGNFVLERLTKGGLESILAESSASQLRQDLAATTSPTTTGAVLSGFKQSDSTGYLAGAVASTLRNKLQEDWSIQDFGGLGDNSLNNDTAIASMCTALALSVTTPGRSRRVHFPAGVYAFSTPFSIPDRCTIFGDGKQSTRLLYTGANNQQVVKFLINTTRSRLESMAVDMGVATGCTAVLLQDCIHHELADVSITSATTASGTGVLFQGGAGGSGSTFNCAFHKTWNVEVFNFNVGMDFDGTVAAPTVSTNHEFYGTHIEGAITAVRAVKATDSNVFFGLHVVQTSNNSVALHLNSGSPAADQGVYNWQIRKFSIDAFGGLSGCTGILMNVQKQLYVDGLYHSPDIYPGNLILDNSGRSISHIIINSNRSALENSMEPITKGIWRASVAARTNTGTFGAGPTDVTWSNELYDKTGSFVPGTGIFTAPVDGVYSFSLSLTHTAAATAADQWQIRLETSARFYRSIYIIPPTTGPQTVDRDYASVEMVAGQTAKWVIERFAGAGNLPLVADVEYNYMGIEYLGPRAT